MKEQFGQSENQVNIIVSEIYADLNKERFEESKIENIRKKLSASCRRIIEEKGEWQSPDLRGPEYIRGFTPEVPITIDGLDYSLVLHEVVNTQRMKSAVSYEPIAVTDRYEVSLRETHNYTRLFMISDWGSQMTGWRGQRLNLEEAQTAISIIDYIDANLRRVSGDTSSPSDY